MIKQKIQSSQLPEPKKPASGEVQHPSESASQAGQASKAAEAKRVGPLDQFINRGPVSQPSRPSSEIANQVGNGSCKMPSNPSMVIELSSSEDEAQDEPNHSSQPQRAAANPRAQSRDETVNSSQSTPQEASGDEKQPEQEKKTKPEPKKSKKSSKAKSRKKPPPKNDKELQLKREEKKKLKEEQGKAKVEKRRAIEQARKEAREQKEKEKKERRQKREEELKQKRKREEEEREKKIQQRKQAQTAKNNLANKLKNFAKNHPDYSDEQGNIKYPVADELLKKYPYVSIRGQKGTLCKRPEPSDLGFVLPMTFQLWINLSNFLEYMQLESFSLEAFHESLAFETEDDVPLLSEIIKVLLVRIVEWMQEHCDQAGAQDFFDDKDRGRMSLLKNFFKEVARLKSENDSSNKGRAHYQQPFECKVMDVIWPELLRWVMISELFEQFKDENTADIAFTLKGLQNPREFMRLSYHYKLLVSLVQEQSVVFLLKIMMSRSQFRTHLTEILVEKSELVQAKQKKQKEQKELAQAVQELVNQIKSKNTQIKQMEKQLEQKTLIFQENKEEKEDSEEKEEGKKHEATELVLDRQESIKVRRGISHLQNDVQRLIRRKNDQERRMANLVNAVNGIDARLNGIKMRQTPLCNDHEGRRYWYFEHDSSRLYVQGPSADEIGFYYKSSQFHELVRSYDECGIKQRRVLEELRRVAGLLDMQDDNGNTPMKGQERFIEKQVAGQAIEDEQEEEEKEVAKALDFEEKDREEEKRSEKEYDLNRPNRREEKSRSDYLTEALQYKIEEEDNNGGIKYYTRRGGEGIAPRQFCAVFTFDKLKEYIQDMELRFSQAINSFLASKWGAQGERIQWRKRLFEATTLFEMSMLLRELDQKIQIITPCDERYAGESKRNTKLWSTSFTRQNRSMWSEYVTDEASQRLPALVFAVNVLDCLINNFITREQNKYLQLHPEENRRQKSSLDFDEFSYFSRGLGNGDTSKVGDAFIVKVPGVADGVENVGGYKMRNRSATRRAIKKVVQKEEINWDDECLICGDGGEVICCEECPTVVHKTCIGLKQAPNCWHCDDCIYAATMRNKTRGGSGRLVIEDSDEE